MSPLRLLIAATLAMTGASAYADTRETPEVGTEQTVAVGGTLWEQYQYKGQPGVIIAAPVLERWGSLDKVDLPADAPLAIVRDKKKLRACQSSLRLTIAPVTIWSSCLTDLDMDGKFDEASYSDNGSSKKLDPPVAYERAIVEMGGDDARTFTKRLLFLGSDGNSLKLSYREFASGTARPAFTEDLTLSLGKTFPQNVAVKDRVITLLGIDGMGLKYKLAK